MRPGPVMWSLSLSELLSAGRLGCIQFNFIFHYLGIYRHINTRLFRDKMTHLSLLSSPHQGGAQLPCLSGNIFMGCTLHFTGSTITGTGSMAQAQPTPAPWRGSHCARSRMMVGPSAGILAFGTCGAGGFCTRSCLWRTLGWGALG